MPQPGDLLCSSRNPIAALKDLSIWGPLVVHYGVMTYDDYVIHTNTNGVIKTKIDDLDWPMDGFKMSRQSSWNVVSSHGTKAADRAEAAYEAQQRGEAWHYEFLFHNCEHFARLMCEGKLRSTQQDALHKLTKNLQDARPLRGLADGFKELNDAAGPHNVGAEAQVGEAQVGDSSGRFRARVRGPRANAHWHPDDGLNANANLSAGEACAEIEGWVGVHLSPNVNTGIVVEDRNFGISVAGFGFSVGHRGVELNNPLGGIFFGHREVLNSR